MNLSNSIMSGFYALIVEQTHLFSPEGINLSEMWNPYRFRKTSALYWLRNRRVEFGIPSFLHISHTVLTKRE